MPQVFGELKDITLMGYVIRTILVGVIVFCWKVCDEKVLQPDDDL